MALLKEKHEIENYDANCYTAFREEIGSLVEQFKKQNNEQ